MWDMYLINYKRMDEKTFKSYKNWKKTAFEKVQTKKEKKINEEKIEEDIELMLMSIQGIRPQKVGGEK